MATALSGKPTEGRQSKSYRSFSFVFNANLLRNLGNELAFLWRSFKLWSYSNGLLFYSEDCYWNIFHIASIIIQRSSEKYLKFNKYSIFKIVQLSDWINCLYNDIGSYLVLKITKESKSKWLCMSLHH